MRIEEHYATLADAVPRASTLLESLGSVPTFHEAHHRRHPLATYRLSLGTVVERLAEVVDALDRVQAHGQRPGEDTLADKQLLDATDHMLDSLMEHLGDCNAILRSLFAPDDDRYRQAYGRFKNSVLPYRDHVGAADNYLKHNQGRLVLMSFHWQTCSCFGYYIEGALGPGTGPAEEVHGSAATAFSFNRDIAFHLCHVFAVSDRLAAAIESAGILPAATSGPHAAGETSVALTDLLSRVAGLPHLYYPDEARRPAPLVRVDDDGVQIEYPSSQVRREIPPRGAQVTTLLSGDGVTRSFKLPYLGREGS